jgi:hypothetical protein
MTAWLYFDVVADENKFISFIHPFLETNSGARDLRVGGTKCFPNCPEEWGFIPRWCRHA